MMVLRRLFLPFLILVPSLLVQGCSVGGSSGSPVPAPGDPQAFTIRDHTLENGLRLLILPRSGVPVASFVTQYRIGGVNERPGTTGIAHFLEHLLFKGTTTVGARDHQAELPLLSEMDRLFDSILALRESPSPDPEAISVLRERIGALEEEASRFVESNEFHMIFSENGARDLNATTGPETTSYFVSLPSNRAELWFILEADRMKNPVFREFFTEREVVAEERRMRLEDNPGGLLYSAHMAAAFQVHPYGTPVVGSMEDIERYARREVESYFRQFYGPNNAVVAIAGDVDPDRILALARRYLEPIPRGELPPPVVAVEPRQTRERRVEVEFDAEPALRIGWKIPDARSEDTAPLHMLTSILTGGRTSRLYRRLVLRDRIASSITSVIEPGVLYPGLFTIQASPLHPNTTEELETAIYQEIETLKETPPSESELQRVRNQLEAVEVRRLRSNFGLAFQAAESATLFGDWRETFDFPRKLLQVTPEDIRRVVRTYFNQDQRTVATLTRPSEAEGEGR